ncbi:uncharacterized protein EI90DRAFT_1241856 [Cantharellus anzutake]|uniref:uncharacterized protein n=1 Tax=Cantharellus anzutake TaxID=1750568 RepID=UPI0019074B99|nr:uncharacterized protein EI90DRAFT_1241856 [Cantharellus anzutake]KAF8310333.1 hypothetical protein EI90DRAFT_1241856 [Cantharellus anzutake]
MSTVQLTVKGVTASSYSGHFKPENVLVDRPDDHNSRWTGAYHTSTPLQRRKQWLKLELERLSVVKTITFGKFKTVHPCNMDHFKNDDIPQIFALNYCNEEGVPFPCRFIKIVPLSPATQTYNISIWSVALHGVSDPELVKQIAEDFSSYCENLTMRLILKHLRSRRLNEAYEKLLRDTGLVIELPKVSELHGALVVRGDYVGAEEIWRSFILASEAFASTETNTAGRILAPLPTSSVPHRETDLNTTQKQNSALSPIAPKTIWHRLRPSVISHSPATSASRGPCARGGHFMVIDLAPSTENEGSLAGPGGLIYLFGGWNGARELADFWVYDLRQSQWRLISEDVYNEERNRGPSPRSCGAAVFDQRSGDIYFMGRYANPAFGDPILRAPGEFVSDSHNNGDSTSNRQNQQQSQNVDSNQISLPPPHVVSAAGTLPTIVLAPSSSSGAVPVSGGSSMSNTRRGRTRRGVESSGGDVTPDNQSGNSSRGRGTVTKDDGSSRSNELKSDFWRYSTRGPNEGKWELISEDTAAEGGPELAHDLAMVVDSENQVLYVSGGRLGSDLEQGDKKYGAFYSYDFKLGRWKRIFGESHHGRLSSQRLVLSRERHSMVLDNKYHHIYILGGERVDQTLSDIFIYSTLTGDVAEVTVNRDSPQPRPSDILRATYNDLSREIYVVSGLSGSSSACNDDSESQSNPRISLWIYSIDNHAWTPISEHARADDDTDPMTSMDAEDPNPRPRLGYSIVYEPYRQTFYAFGGNAGAEVRLDDFWALSLVRPDAEDIIRKGSLAIRRQRYFPYIHVLRSLTWLSGSQRRVKTDRLLRLCNTFSQRSLLWWITRTKRKHPFSVAFCRCYSVGLPRRLKLSPWPTLVMLK